MSRIDHQLDSCMDAASTAADINAKQLGATVGAVLDSKRLQHAIGLLKLEIRLAEVITKRCEE